MNDKITKIRELMEENSISVYIITKFDPHQTEYAGEYWNSVRFASGFTGSNGTLVITADEAGLWTDGRYALQAEKQLTGSGIKIHMPHDNGYKDFATYAVDTVEDGGMIGFDGRTLSNQQAGRLKSDTKKINVRHDIDIIGCIWENRPQHKLCDVFELGVELCGKSRKEKLAELRQTMSKSGAGIYFANSLDEIAWVLNLRALELKNSVIFFSYLSIETDNAYLFTDANISADIADRLQDDGVLIRPYDDASAYLNDAADQPIMLDTSKICYTMFKELDGKKLINSSPSAISLMKAVKNETELSMLRETQIRDGISVFRLMRWIKGNAGKQKITEHDIDLKLYELRSADENFLCRSFDTIAGFNANGAVIHYRAEEDDCAEITSDGLLLVDSGATYLDGTTDITRTFALGSISGEVKRDFTLALKSHIALAKAVFLYGATGMSLDTISRLPLWKRGIDYKHGTGHGIGFCLNVHEGPHSISMYPNPVKLEPGMLISNEPGIYRAGKYGIRHENIILVKEHSETEFGKFLEFETVTYCPFDLDAIDVNLLDEEELDWLNRYHDTVYEKLVSRLTPEESEELKNATRKIYI